MTKIVRNRTSLSTLDITRRSAGWALVDATIQGRSFRFATAHLEQLHSGVQLAQANELLAGPLRTDLPVVFVGDFNDETLFEQTATYAHITAAGFTDAWAVGGSGPGFTCCQQEELSNATSQLTSRIDLVFFDRRLRLIDVDIAGEDPADRVESAAAGGKIWPSDHAGVAAIGRLKPEFSLAHVANLLLARATMRQKEIAIRLTLGASRARLIRQLLTESMLLSLLGGALGLCVTWWAAGLLLAYLHTKEFLMLDASPDARVLGFTLFVAIFSGAVFGLLPALQSSRSDLTVALKEGATKQAYGKSRLRDLLVILQVSLSLVLLIGTGLLVKTSQNLWQSNPISEPEHLLLMSIQPSLQQYNDAKQNELYRRLMERIAVIPGVKSASLAGNWSIADSSFFKEDALIEGREASGKQTSLSYKVVAPNYFQTMGTALLRGRDFTAQDREGTQGVIVINETLARRCWPNEDPIGKRLKLLWENSHREVIGLAKDRKWDEEAQPFMYLPLFQKHPWPASEMTLHIHTTVDPKSLIAAVRNEAQAVDHRLPIFNIGTLAEFINDELGAQRMAVIIIGLSGLLALILASVGLYGVMSYTVLQRTHEIGVRLALGAQARDVLKLVVEQGMKLALFGFGLGLVGALALTRLLKTLLFGVSATDPLTFVVIALLLA